MIMKEEKVEEKKAEVMEEKKAEPKPEERKVSASKLLKGKNWYTIVSPALLGEALAADPSTLPGRKVTASLMELTGDPSRYYMTMRFKISEISGMIAKTVFDGHECTRDFTARIVQRRTQRLDTNDVVQLKDGRIRVKTVAICNRHVTESVAKALCGKLKELMRAAVADKTMDEFIMMFASGELQNSVRAEVNSIYPLRTFEFNKTEVQ